MAQEALYYPYIHVETDWLKRTLLLFNSVSRMIPREYQRAPNDDPQLAEFQRRGLLASANLYTRRVFDAQARLAQKIRESARDPAFLVRYGNAATIAEQTDFFGFQIHPGKSTEDLVSVLRETGLAWGPANREPYDVGLDYIQVNPRVGQAIMSTLAIACAQSEGLNIVGDSRSGELHRTLLEKDLDHVYDAWLADVPSPPPAAPTGEQMFEFLIGCCDVSDLSPEALQNLDREPLQDLMDQLRREASKISAMDPGPKRDERFTDEVSDVLKKWGADRKNFGHFWKLFWGDGASAPAATFFKTIGDKVVAALGGGAIANVTAAHVALTAALPGALFAASGALVIGVGSHGVASYAKMVDESKHSRYRYLTTLQGAGVVFRSAGKTDSVGPATC